MDAAVLESLRATALAEQFKVKEAETTYLLAVHWQNDRRWRHAFPASAVCACHRARLLARIAQDQEASRSPVRSKSRMARRVGRKRALPDTHGTEVSRDVQLALGDAHSALASGHRQLCSTEG